MTMKELLKGKSNAGYVEYGYGQVEPNHLSAQRNGQIYAQLPTETGLELLENGQFVKYDYAKGEVNLTGPGEWMLVLNEIKLYRGEPDCAFAMIKGNYLHEVYSPYDADNAEKEVQTRYYGKKGYRWDETANDNNGGWVETETENGGDILAPTSMFELDATDNPFHVLTGYKAKKMADRRAMVPRVFKTMIGDIFTTNTIADADVELGAELVVGDNGYLTIADNAGANAGTMKWQVVKKYTMPDGQKGVKIMRIA